MVTIDYIGRFGNNLFQYVTARLLAVRNGLALETPWNRFDMIGFQPNPDGRRNSERLRIDDQHDHDTDTELLKKDLSRYHLNLKGYFQNRAFYDPNKDLIKSWMILPAVERRDEIGLHIRLDDYKVTRQVPIIKWVWYHDIINLPENKGKRVVAVVDKPKASWEIDYINHLKDCTKCEVVSQSAFDDFHLLRSFGTLVCSNSSFAWWAAFLGVASKIYTFKRWMINAPRVNLAGAEGMTPMDGKYIWE